MIGKSIVNPNLNVIADNIKEDVFNNINCIQVGKLISFNAKNQTAVAQIQVKRVLNDGTEVEYAPLIDCPCFELGGSLAGIDIPYSAGDTCIILFNDRCIDNWFGTNQIQTPIFPRTHDFSDALILVGIRSLQNLLTLVEGLKIRYNSNSIVLSNSLTTFNNPIKASYMYTDGSIGLTTTQTFKDGAGITKTMTIKGGIITDIQ